MTRRAAIAILVALSLILVLLVLRLPLRPAAQPPSPQPTATFDPYGHWTPQQRQQAEECRRRGGIVGVVSVPASSPPRYDYDGCGLP
jgi:hypothetical protein